MKECKFIRKKIQECLDGAMSPVEKEKFDSHLEICGECSKHYSAAKLADDIVKNLQTAPQKEVPVGLRTRILAEAQSVSPARWLSVTLETARYAGVAAILAIGIFSVVQLNICKTGTNPAAAQYTANDFITQSIRQAEESYQTDIITKKASGLINAGGLR